MRRDQLFRHAMRVHGTSVGLLESLRKIRLCPLIFYRTLPPSLSIITIDFSA